jgi:hypothetical protein
LYIYITHLCQITSLSFTDERCVDQIDERNRFPYQIYLSHYSCHPVICVPQLPGIVWPRANLWFSHSIDKHMMYVLCFNLFNCLFGSQVYWFIQYNTFLYEMQYSCPFLNVPSFGSYHYFLDSGLVLTGNYWSHGFLLQSGNHHSESFAMASASLLTATGCLCHKWPHIFSVCRSEALECFLVLVGFVLCMLSTYITSLVVMSATISA